MTQGPNIARLEFIDPRMAWAHEAHQFTPCLYENLNHLSDAVGMQLEAEGKEVAVERFSADILARNVQDDTLVLIENQLASSDHTHLGQIMTYLAGLEARSVIWVATSFRESHLSAIKWLNEHTDERFGFFAVELKVVRIADSPFAPLFEVIERPNIWERHLQTVAASRETSEIGQQRLAFWQAFVDRLPGERDRSGDASRSSNRYRVLPDLGFRISMYIASGGDNGNFGIFYGPLHGGDPVALGERLRPHTEALSAALGARFTGSNPSHYFPLWTEGDFKDEVQWDRIIRWLAEKADLYEQTARRILGDSR